MSTRSRTTHSAGADQLGDTSFDDWYDRPLFEVEPDERLEQLATSRRAPVRAVGSILLRLSPDRPPSDADLPYSRPTVRERAGRFLDRWADAEAASQRRLEGIVLPRRWRT